jgi:hypothetical protein
VAATGFSSKTGKTLLDVDKLDTVKRWCLASRLLPTSLVIKDVYDSEGVEAYVVTKHYRQDPKAESEPYNLRLLRKLNLTSH